MKTSWVLTEDDKTKLGARRHLSGDMEEGGEAPPVNIKTEESDEAVENVKQPQSSPLSFNSPGVGGNNYYPGSFSHHLQLSRSLYPGQTQLNVAVCINVSVQSGCISPHFMFYL